MCFELMRPYFTILVLVFTTWVVAATSYNSLSSVDSRVYMSSDCVTPAIEEEEAIVADGVIIDPPGAKFTDYGLPVDDISNLSEITGNVNGVPRDCKTTYWGWAENNDSKVFSCHDDGTYSCTVILWVPE